VKHLTVPITYSTSIAFVRPLLAGLLVASRLARSSAASLSPGPPVGDALSGRLRFDGAPGIVSPRPAFIQLNTPGVIVNQV